ncbi:MAG TPA: hypothetical protein VI958_13005 [Acidobacteriota bacterium]
MKIRKSEIQLAEHHPSVLLRLKAQSVLTAPLVIDQKGVLIDGYRRFQLAPDDEVDVIQIHVADLFDAALALNQRTRIWDETDCFLWTRWSRNLQHKDPELPVRHFAEALFGAEISQLFLIAARNLTLRQVQLILNSPKRYRSFLERFISDDIHLNSNESAAFIDLACDLANKLGKSQLEDLFKLEQFASILESENLTARQKGEALLKAMRVLRYPYYQKKAHEFSLLWRELNLGKGIQAKKGLFLERGVLELSLSSSSFEELKKMAAQLSDSLDSPLWSRIWND